MSPKTIYRLRKKVLGLTQGEFAQIVGYSAITVSYWETGRTKPTPKAIAAIRKVTPAKR